VAPFSDAVVQRQEAARSGDVLVITDFPGLTRENALDTHAYAPGTLSQIYNEERFMAGEGWPDGYRMEKLDGEEGRVRRLSLPFRVMTITEPCATGSGAHYKYMKPGDVFVESTAFGSPTVEAVSAEDMQRRSRNWVPCEKGGASAPSPTPKP
jgi:hypothetical protein